MKEPNDKQIDARNALVDLLDKMGIKSAAIQRQLSIFENAAKLARDNFGRPDTFFMDPQTLSAFKKAFSGPKTSRKAKS